MTARLHLTALGGIALALAGCDAAGLAPQNQTLSGDQRVAEFRVPSGTLVSVPSDLSVDADGDVLIEGDLIALEGSGASITLRSRSGVVTVAGRVMAGSGASGSPPESVSGMDVGGEAGMAGGAVRIEAGGGVVRIRGNVSAGAGGNGSTVSGFGLAAALSAISGGGGPGGSVTVVGRNAVLEGIIQAGNGGAGGGATVDPFRDPAAEKTTADALARGGGPGGRVEVVIQGKAGFVRLGGTLAAGRGGDTMAAECKGGASAADRGVAVVEKGGDGGDVRIRVGDPSQIIRAGGTQMAGNGGDAGKPDAPADKPIARALARESAEARAGGGGLAGKVLFADATVTQGEGGDSGNSVAQKRGVLATTDRGARHSGPTPGKASRTLSE